MANETPNQNNCDNHAASFFNKAAEACASGDLLLGLHLYLAAYEKAAADATVPVSAEVSALREAWRLACDLKERSMAEYVFEKLEPYLTGGEIAECAMKLQELALDRLEQYGFSREDLQDMAESISQDLLGDSARVVKVESVSIPHMNMFGVPDATIEARILESTPQAEPAAEAAAEAAEGAEVAGEAEASPVAEADADEKQLSDHVFDQAFENLPGHKSSSKPPHVELNIADVNDFNPYDEFRTSSVGKSYHVATTEGSGAYVFTRDEERATELERAKQKEAQAAAQGDHPTDDEQAGDEQAQAKQAEAPASDSDQGGIVITGPNAPAAPSNAIPADAIPAMPDTPAFNETALNYRNLVGYDQAVEVMRDMGVGMQNDPGFLNFVHMLNTHHGLSSMPAIDTLLFRAAVIEDAMRFVDATAGELGLPVLRMSMEEGVGGAPVLCVTTQGNNRPRMNHAHNRFDGPGILVIDDLDSWSLPEVPENAEGFGNFIMANISRGAREAVNLIRSAVEDPDVYVLATASAAGEPDPFFYDLLEPITIVDITNPTEKERAEIWAEIANDHPSIRAINRNDLVRFSEGMARYDLYLAAREAVEDAYKMGLMQRNYVPVSPQNLFDKLAACQPLDSERYRELEEAVIDDFRNDLDHLEDLLSDGD